MFYGFIYKEIVRLKNGYKVKIYKNVFNLWKFVTFVFLIENMRKEKARPDNKSSRETAFMSIENYCLLYKHSQCSNVHGNIDY